MIGVKLFCVASLLGLAAAGMVDVDTTKLRKPVVTAFNAQPHWDVNFCRGRRDMDAFAHPDSCEQYLICWQGTLWEQTCPRGTSFDARNSVCTPAHNPACLNHPPAPNVCPQTALNQLTFLAGPTCEEFVICVNGVSSTRQCRPGQHWNAAREFCDEPMFAMCNRNNNGNNVPQPQQIPICPPRFTGQLAHPNSCNMFVNCTNGNRNIQQCAQGQLFDNVLRRCVQQNVARC